MDSAGAVAMELNPRLVSFHAVTRYVQRIMGTIVPWAEPPLTSEQIAEAHCLTAGTSIDEVRALIWVPAVQVASASRFSMVQTRQFRALLQDGVVASILKPKTIRRRRFKDQSRREDRRLMRQAMKRRKRKPSPSLASREDAL